MNQSNLKKKFQCYFEKLLTSKAVQLVTLIVKDYVTCEFTCINARKFLDRHATYCYNYTSRPQEFLSQRSVLFRPLSNRSSNDFVSNKF